MTSNNLNAGLTIKWTDKKVKENDTFLWKKVFGAALKLSAKKVFHIGQVLIKNGAINSFL